MKKTAAVFGSTGLVGKTLVKELRNHPDFDKIYCYARKPSMFMAENTEFRPFETDNFSIEADIDVIFCALGTTIKKAGSKEAFREVDLLAVKRIAEQAHKAGIKQMIVVSSMGAKANSNNFYLRTKGQMEEEVKNTGISHIVFIRPSLLLGKRDEKRTAEMIGKTVIKPFSWLMVGPLKQYRPVKAADVAKAMITAASQPQDKVVVIENREILESED